MFSVIVQLDRCARMYKSTSAKMSAPHCNVLVTMRHAEEEFGLSLVNSTIKSVAIALRCHSTFQEDLVVCRFALVTYLLNHFEIICHAETPENTLKFPNTEKKDLRKVWVKGRGSGIQDSC
jgi:hypothetical protein